MTGYGESFAMKSYQQLIGWSVWSGFDPEFRRRLLGLMNFVIDQGHGCGIGGGLRSYENQYRTFITRYRPCTSLEYERGRALMNSKPGTYGVGYARDCTVDGHRYWILKKPGTGCAPPGGSYHESTTKSGLAIATDMLAEGGNFGYLIWYASLFGLAYIDGSTDPAHFQPIDIPKSRSDYNPNIHDPLKRWDFGINQWTLY